MLLTKEIQEELKQMTPYIDIDEQKTGKVTSRYIHGGFENTDIRFSCYFPEKNAYQQRFIHFNLPVTGSEDSSKGLDRIDFALEHGAYFLESNMGGLGSVGDSVYHASALVAEYSRTMAAEIYGQHRPYGYVYGGSGGAFKTISCVQSTDVWDGSVALVIGSPMAIPNVFTVRAHAFRILRHKLDDIANATEPGGNKEFFDTLSACEKDAYNELTKMGFPTRVWFAHQSMGLGALPIFMPTLAMMDPTYFEDFWSKPGYLGFDKNGSAAQDRVRHKGKVVDCLIEAESNGKAREVKSGTDDAWQNLKSIDLSQFEPWIRLDDMPKKNAYLIGAELKILTGKSKGKKLPLRFVKEGRLYIDEGFNITGLDEVLKNIEYGDEILVDNSDFIAAQTYHRHQVPETGYPVWDQFRDADGKPIFPQRETIMGPIMAYGGAGSIQDGSFNGKMIVVDALTDESAFPWQADWYKQQVVMRYGEQTSNRFRLWYIDHAMHGDHDKEPDTLHVAGYSGAEYQALLDLIQWVEKDVEPPEDTNYTVNDGQVYIPDQADSRQGIQPTVRLSVNGKKTVTIKAGEEVTFEAYAQVPSGAGVLTKTQWSFEGEKDFPVDGILEFCDTLNNSAVIKAKHTYNKAGTYFAVARVQSERHGDINAEYTQIKNLDRVRIVVE